MNILVDIGHPGHVHLTKFLIRNLEQDGHKVIITVKDVPIIKHLLDFEGINYITLGSKGKGLFNKIIKQIYFDKKLIDIIKKEKIQIATGTSMAITRVSKLCGITSINLDDDDDEVQKISVIFSHPFSDVRLTPSAIKGHRKTNKAMFYEGTHELAYLHPNYFKIDSSTLRKAQLIEGEKFFILRFVAFQAYHDGGQGGISFVQKQKLINLLKQYGRIIITSERPIEPEFEQYRLPVPPEEIHSLMAYASMFLGDSQTMTSEAAILGVPALKCNTFAGRLSVPNELEQEYGLCYAYHPDDFDKFYDHVKRLLEDEHTKEEWAEKKKKFLADKIDVTAFFTWFIENYPESRRIMKENPDYQYRFK